MYLVVSFDRSFGLPSLPSSGAGPEVLRVAYSVFVPWQSMQSISMALRTSV